MTDIVVDLVGPGAEIALAAAVRAEAAASTVRVGTNTTLGEDALDAGAPGTSNVAFGSLALRDNTGNSNVAVGDEALRENLGGSDNTAIGRAADRVIEAGSRNVTIGSSAGLSRTAGSDNVIIGQAAAGTTTTGGSMNVFVGAKSGSGTDQKVDAANSIAIGFEAFTTEDNQIVLGNDDHDDFRMFGTSMIRYDSTNTRLFMGGAGGGLSHSGSVVLAIGPDALYSGEGISNALAIGRQAMYWTTGGGGCVAVGDDAMKNGNHLNEADGMAPGTTLGNPTDCTAVGREAGRNWQGIVGGTAVGRLAAAKTTTGTGVTAVGDTALRDNVSGEYNVGLGYAANYRNVTGSYNVAVGRVALGGNDSFSRCVGIGDECGENATGSDNTLLGYRNGRALVAASSNTMIGASAGTHGSQKVDAVNSIAIGAGAYTTRNNETVIGDAAHTHFTVAGVTFTKAQLEALLALVD